MQVRRLDHVNLRTRQLAAMVDWYVSVLGLENGPRPAFPFPGAWLYAGQDAIVHLVEVAGDDDPGAGSEGPLKLEHFALAAEGRAEFEARLHARQERFDSRKVPGLAIVQINLWDPDGNHIHVDFED